MRYALDVHIWNVGRDCKQRDRYLLQDTMRRADAALLKIESLIDKWNNPEVWESIEDLYRLRAIKQRLEMEGAERRLWAEHPPWEGLR